jgi:hypothetical protein
MLVIAEGAIKWPLTALPSLLNRRRAASGNRGAEPGPLRGSSCRPVAGVRHQDSTRSEGQNLRGSPLIAARHPFLRRLDAWCGGTVEGNPSVT